MALPTINVIIHPDPARTDKFAITVQGPRSKVALFMSDTGVSTTIASQARAWDSEEEASAVARNTTIRWTAENLRRYSKQAAVLVKAATAKPEHGRPVGQCKLTSEESRTCGRALDGLLLLNAYDQRIATITDLGRAVAAHLQADGEPK